MRKIIVIGREKSRLGLKTDIDEFEEAGGDLLIPQMILGVITHY